MKFIKKFATAALMLAVMASLTGAALAAEYTDIPAGAWYASAVEHVTEHGIFGGYGDGRFGPGAAITREMFVTALGRMSGVDENAENHSPFTDIDPDGWSAPYISWAYENKITGGTTATTFSPKREITREQVAVMLHHYLVLNDMEPETQADDISTYADSGEISSWAEDGIQAMRDHGLMSGNNAKEFKPKDSISRAETAVVLTRLHERMQPVFQPQDDPKTEQDTPSAAPSFTVSIDGHSNPQALVFRTSADNVTEVAIQTEGGGTVAASATVISIFPADLGGDMSWKTAPDGSIYPMFLPNHYSLHSSDSGVVSVSAEGRIAVAGSGSAVIEVRCLDDDTVISIPVHVNTGSSAAGQDIDADFVSAVQSEIIRLVDAERISAGLPALEYIAAAQTAADIRAAEFATNGSHTRPDGTMFSTVLKDVGLAGGFHSENGSTYTFNTDESVESIASGIVSGWMNSAGHRGNIVDSFHLSGVVGAHLEQVSGNSYRIYVVQLFSGYGAEKFR